MVIDRTNGEPTHSSQGRRWPFISTDLLVALILAFSMALNLWGNRWGAPDYWHPDELTKRAIGMFDQRTVKPEFYFYGGLHYYVIALGAVLPAKAYGKLFDPMPEETGTETFSKWKERQDIRKIWFARNISALMATLQVFLTYLIGNLLFGRTIGILAALFLSVSPYFIAIAHFATVDTPSNFWYWLSSFLALLSWKRGGDFWFALACGTAGLAIGTKIDKLIIVLPLLFSFFQENKGTRFRKILKFSPLIIVGYLFANPSMLVSPFEFLDGTTRELFFNILRSDSDSSSSYVQIFRDMASGMGLLLFLAAIGGVGYAARRFLVNKDRAETGWLLASVVPYYLLFGPRAFVVWYAPFFFPVFGIFAAYGCKRILDLSSPRFRVVTGAVPAVIFLSCLIFSISLVLQITKDSRYSVAKWIEEQIPAGKSIQSGARGPAISKEKYRVTYLSEYKAFDDQKFVREWRDRLNQNNFYFGIRNGILNLEQFMAKISGHPPRKEPYKAWFDKVVRNVETANAKMVTNRNAEVATADYVILVEYMEYARIATLILPNSGYHLAGRFQYRNPLGIPVSFPFVNPEIYVFSKG